MSEVCVSGGYHEWDNQHKRELGRRCSKCGTIYSECTKCGKSAGDAGPLGITPLIVRSPSGERQAVLCGECWDWAMKNI
jgi:hypothetical protein